MEYMQDPKFWVAIAFFGFIAAVAKPVGRMIAKGLDGRAARISQQLEDASKLRAEAEAILAQYKARQQQVMQEAEDILAATRAEADRLRLDAETALKASLENRARLAQERIALAEAKALSDVKNHVVDLAMGAARHIIMQHMEKDAAEELIRISIAEVERKLH